MSMWKVVPSLSGGQFCPFVLSLPLPFEGPEEPLLPAALPCPFCHSFLQGTPLPRACSKWMGKVGISLELHLEPAGSTCDTQHSQGPSLP